MKPSERGWEISIPMERKEKREQVIYAHTTGSREYGKSGPNYHIGK
jgi:hypothetical protein